MWDEMLNSNGIQFRFIQSRNESRFLHSQTHSEKQPKSKHQAMRSNQIWDFRHFESIW
jgi:hypothetical protein